VNCTIHSQHCALNSFQLHAPTNTVIKRQRVNSYHCNRYKAPDKQDSKSTNLSSSKCAKPHTKIYINKHYHKIISKCGSPQAHTLVVHKLHQFPCQWHPLHYECSHLSLLWRYQSSVLKLQTQINTNTWHNPYAFSTQTNYTNTHLIPHWNL